MEITSEQIVHRFSNGSRLAKVDGAYYLVDTRNQIKERIVNGQKQAQVIDTPGYGDMEGGLIIEQDFNKGVAVIKAERNHQYDKRYQDYYYDHYGLLTESGYVVEIGSVDKSDRNSKPLDLEANKLVQLARSIYSDPVKFLSVTSAQVKGADAIKAYVDIAQSGLRDALEKADIARNVAHNRYTVSSEIAKADRNFDREVAAIEKLAEKIKRKYEKLIKDYEQEQASTSSGKIDRAKKAIAGIFSEPQKEA